MPPPGNWTSAVAVWGAITGTIGATVAILNAFRDRSRLRLSLDEVPAAEAAKIFAELSQANSSKFVFVEVVNVGRRVRYVYRPELWVSNNDLLIPEKVDFVFVNGGLSKPTDPWQTWRLEEGQSATFVFGEPAKYLIIGVDVPDTLARTRRRYAGQLTGRLRWFYGRWRGRKHWKHIRDLGIDLPRTRHHKDD